MGTATCAVEKGRGVASALGQTGLAGCCDDASWFHNAGVGIAITPCIPSSKTGKVQAWLLVARKLTPQIGA